MPGYSIEVIRTNRKADSNKVGVRLGRYCISKGIPVLDVVNFFGVARQTVYNWFFGTHEPKPIFAEAIEEFLKRAK
jgi:CRISPR/Cas system CMR-associated protein Cmr3 (group 5 of RAMP superfamily)